MQFPSTYEMSAMSTRDTDKESRRDCPVVVSVEELASELMNLVSFVLWSETFPCRSLWAAENQFTDRKCRHHLGTAEGQGGQSLPGGTGFTSPVTPPEGPWLCERVRRS